MLPNNLILISAQPYDFYFQWQIEVQITNFREHGVSDKMHVLIWYPKGNFLEGDKWRALQKKYKEVKFFFYEDPGTDIINYIPQLRPHILEKHFEVFKEQFKDKIFFYHDSDIIFNYLPDFQALCEGHMNWESDTNSYLDYSYLKNKEIEGRIPKEEVISNLESISGLSPGTIKSYDGNSGGAQYILKNVDSSFWKDVGNDCLSIRKYLKDDINRKYFTSENKGFQSWCADMWAINFNLWKRGKETKITKLLDFSWATDSIETYNIKPIFHNAGATASNRVLFFKGAWINTSPIGKQIKGVSKIFASSKYVEAISKVK